MYILIYKKPYFDIERFNFLHYGDNLSAMFDDAKSDGEAEQKADRFIEGTKKILKQEFENWCKKRPSIKKPSIPRELSYKPIRLIKIIKSY